MGRLFCQTRSIDRKSLRKKCESSTTRTGRQNYEIYEISSGIAKYIPEGGDIITDAEERSVAFAANGFRLIKPITENNHSVQNFLYDENNDIFTCSDDQEATIKGIAKFPFMWQQMTLSEKPKIWSFNTNSNMSEKFKTALQPMIDKFKEISYTVTSLSFQVSNPKEPKFGLKLSIRTNRGSSQSAYYYYTHNGNNDELTISYESCDATGNAFLVYGVESFVKGVMSSSFSLVADQSNFNLSNIKLVDKNDPEMWVILSLQ